MADIKSGTNVASTITTFTPNDTYATAIANEIKGGRHSTLTIVDRNSIPLDRREIGMTCYVAENDDVYRLINNPTTATTQDSDWVLEYDLNDLVSVEDLQKVTDELTTISNQMSNFVKAESLTPINDSLTKITTDLASYATAEDLEQVKTTLNQITETLAKVVIDISKIPEIYATIEDLNGLKTIVDSISKIIPSLATKEDIKGVTDTSL